MKRFSRVAAVVMAALGSRAAPLEVALSMNGDVRVGTCGASLSATIYREGWTGIARGVRTDFAFPDATAGTASFDLFSAKEPCAVGRATLQALADARALLDVVLSSTLDQKPEAVVLALTLPCEAYARGSWRASTGAKGVFPKTYAGQMNVLSADVRWVEIASAAGETFRVAFPADTRVHIQDDRQWVQTITLRISSHLPAAKAFRAGDQRVFSCFLSAAEGVKTKIDRPVVIKAGDTWIPLDYRKNILAGSALDFSGQGLQDAPAGKHGWLKNVGGHFEFEKLPGRPQRFYGVNLCFDACFPEKELADELATRLVRLGYNTVRIHHYESANGVIKDSGDRLTLNAERIGRLDYLLAKLFEKGLYVTTDLFTTRPVMWRDVGIDRDGQVEQQVYKNLIAVHEPAFENWKTFARNLLTHVNPHTGRRYADEPGLPLISLVNEGHLTWCWEQIKRTAPMKRAWKTWIDARRAQDPAFAQGVSDDAAANAGWNNAALICFMADTESDLAARQRAFLASLGVKALLTSQNCGSHYTPLMAMRAARYDYVDDHFYVDHPEFLSRAWSLPSRCGNGNPVLASSLQLVACAYTRMPDKPFTVTEWNFSGPGMFRGVGGIMTGAMSALQDWDGLWRFAYSHGLDGLRDRRGVPGYFDASCDPLSQASDRASVCLFLRRDLEPLADRLVQMVTPDTFVSSGSPTGVVPAWRDAAWNVRVATGVAPVAGAGATCNLGASRHAARAPVPLADNRAIRLDRERGTFVLDTPRTAGAFTPSGAIGAGAITFDAGDVAATVWASSLDGQPLVSSRRILVTHLTDVQADGNVYADEARRILLRWGNYPPVVRDGSARIALSLQSPDLYEVWGLDTTGRRLARIPATAEDGTLRFTATVKGPAGARLLYEVVRAR
ncbi:MAG: hypothetical protein ACI4Q3_01025 [Kiritimatiellia bacterium]